MHCSLLDVGIQMGSSVASGCMMSDGMKTETTTYEEHLASNRDMLLQTRQRDRAIFIS
jgi:hypothetical protein